MRNVCLPEDDRAIAVFRVQRPLLATVRPGAPAAASLAGVIIGFVDETEDLDDRYRYPIVADSDTGDPECCRCIVPVFRESEALYHLQRHPKDRPAAGCRRPDGDGAKAAASQPASMQTGERLYRLLTNVRIHLPRLRQRKWRSPQTRGGRLPRLRGHTSRYPAATASAALSRTPNW